MSRLESTVGSHPPYEAHPLIHKATMLKARSLVISRLLLVKYTRGVRPIDLFAGSRCDVEEVVAHAVRGPKYVVKKGKTPLLTAEEARELPDSIETVRNTARPNGTQSQESALVGLRDRALIAGIETPKAFIERFDQSRLAIKRESPFGEG
jgi:hypothetical protein